MKDSSMQCIFSVIRSAVLLLALVTVFLWTLGAIIYLPVIPDVLRTPLSGLLGIASLLALIPKTRLTGSAVVLILMLVMVGAFYSTTASHDRNWNPSVARLSRAEFNTPTNVTIKDIRNFHYNSETDYVIDYYDKTVNLDDLSSVDFLVSYWSSRSLAHVMVSFGFGDKDFITFSIETRPEAQESYSTFAGFYRNFELTYVVADERDVVALRTRIRQPNEHVYLFRTRITPENAKKLFLKYLSEINKINETPSFYNTLTTNCTSQILWNIQSYNPSVVYNWKIFLSGYLPNLLYEIGAVDTSKPFAQFFDAALVDERANVDITGEGFSQRIRQGMPQPGYARFGVQ